MDKEDWAGFQDMTPGPSLECVGKSVWEERLYVA